MESNAILRKMAEKWREAAEEVAYPALRKCYVERAARYELLAARSNGPADPLFPSDTGEGDDR